MTEDERKQVLETANSFKSNAKVFEKSTLTCCETLKYSYKDIAMTFAHQARLLEILAK